MNTVKSEIKKLVESRQEKIWKISDAIWSYAELGLEENKSSKLLADTLEAAGFTLERGVAGMPTAFVASWSHGNEKPVVGFLAEYDALPALSQKAGSSIQEPLVPGAPGHGCGHNTMGALQLLTVLTMQDIARKEGLDCTLKYFGCPAEEMLVSRPYMIRAGVFNGLDAVIDCHSAGDFSTPYGIAGNGMYSFVVTFKGKTAHAGSNPWMGRSAADAVELMHAGTERMREHTPVTQRTHWVTLEGGEAPNVVPDRASTWYFIRDIDDNLESRFNWVMDCAKGAALMTQTIYEVKVLTAIHQRYHNKALAEVIFENIKAVGKPEYTNDEHAFARTVQKAMGLPVIGLQYPLEFANAGSSHKGGSSDVGDVTLVAPCAQVRFPVRFPGDFPGHHWTVVTSALSSYAHKGITVGARAACGAVYDILTSPELLVQIKNEFEKLSEERPYKSFLPGDAKPPLGWNKSLMEKYRAEIEKFYLTPY